MAANDPAADRIPWLLREGKFRFEFGLRQSDGSFFGTSSDADSILPQRRNVLDEDAARYAGMLDEGAGLLEKAHAFAKEALGGTIPRKTPLWEDCVELGRRWEPDFLLLKPGPDGVHRLAGGCVCFPSSWDLREKLGHSIDSIHAPVPTLNEELGPRISAFLHRLKPGAIWERWNWGLAAVPVLNHHPALAHPRLHADVTLDDSWVRIEHQAFRSLDTEGGVLFGIRLSVLSLREFALHPEAALRLAELLETMPEEIAGYKGLTEARHPLARQLRAEA